ncbi:AIM24 family protein [Nocardia rhizosphaerae]|uniref:AIM24 family protein n=1 Tax=Nocardia rhizosphaerae TaxID=1691571 RepID=A0ABV8LAM6_9NOCA
MRSDIFHANNSAQPATQLGITLQHSKCVKAAVNGEVFARQGAMIGYRGQFAFEVKSQGLGNLVKRFATGEGVPLMTCRGQGEVWFAHHASHCFLIDLDPGDSLSINGKHILVYEPSLGYDIQMVSSAGAFVGGGLFNCVFHGQGRLAITSHGQPIVIPVTPQQPVFADSDALIGWSAGLQTSIVRTQSFGSMLRGGSGEVAQVRFVGAGFVILQPSEFDFGPARTR